MFRHLQIRLDQPSLHNSAFLPIQALVGDIKDIQVTIFCSLIHKYYIDTARHSWEVTPLKDLKSSKAAEPNGDVGIAYFFLKSTVDWKILKDQKIFTVNWSCMKLQPQATWSLVVESQCWNI